MVRVQAGWQRLPLQCRAHHVVCAVLRRLHRAVYTLGRDLSTVCEAQFQARTAGQDVRDDAGLAAMLDAGADRFVKYVMDMVGVLRNAGIIPYLVFDGDALPAKKATESDRYEYVSCGVYRV